ncbi:hypothetical protein Nepgr_000371 [Nepenthes gracilis]|uniref:Riboflavin kinase n=1 Tax=Nepenthes gracilis TaxID=150966 RepID=A0AAD3RVE8_NEPGR|nr:hypothetical protein Nepgr_000371 [Nepenthes gracilis]
MTISALDNHAGTQILAVIFDLDGTLLDTERATWGLLKDFLAKYGKVLKADIERRRLGTTQKESAIAIVRDYDLPLTPDQFIEEITPFYKAKWAEAKALPGANRLIVHLHKHQVPFSLASNSLRENIEGKLSHHKDWKECFLAILGSDQVKSGKPAPDLYLEAAERMGVDPIHCLVIEDSLVGVKAAKAAGMKVVAVPSESNDEVAALADSVLHSLLDFRPELWALPPFEDWVDNALPIDPIYLEDLFSDGFLTVFTGQLEQEDGPNVLPDQVCGAYFGWAKVKMVGVFKVVAAIGWELSSALKRKIQLCLVDGSNAELSNQHLQLLLVGYIRAFDKQVTSWNMEVNEEDRSIARCSFEQPMFTRHAFEADAEDSLMKKAAT